MKLIFRPTKLISGKTAWLAVALPMALPFAADAATVSQNLSIKVVVPLTISFSPANPTIPCNSAPGTVVATGAASGGDGNPIAWSMTGDTTDFAIAASTGVITVAASGAFAGCATQTGIVTDVVTVTATQN